MQRETGCTCLFLSGISFLQADCPAHGETVEAMRRQLLENPELMDELTAEVRRVLRLPKEKEDPQQP